MSKNIDQIFIANPASSMQTSDLLYLGRSPYGATDDFAITFANFSGSLGSITPTASTLAKWDSNVNLNTNSILNGYTSTVIFTGDLYLTLTSGYYQYITSSGSPDSLNIWLPDISTYTTHALRYKIYNTTATGTIYVQASDSSVIVVLNPGESVEVSSGASNSWWKRDIIQINNTTNLSCLSIATQTTSSFFNAWLSLTSRATGTGPFYLGAYSDTYFQLFTGSTTDSVYVPPSSGSEGLAYQIINQSTGAISVYDSDSSTLITTIASNAHLTIICITEIYGGPADWYYY